MVDDDLFFEGSLALYALTSAAAGLALTFFESEPGARLFVLESAWQRSYPKIVKDRVTVFPKGVFKEIVSDHWQRFDGHIFIMATGIVIRQLAPLLQGKTRDPAVVVCDEKGDFAISLLSGHIGGANRLARKVAEIFSGQAVITTATDVQGLPAIDEIAAHKGFDILNPEAIKDINGLLLARQTIAVIGHSFWSRVICSHFDERVVEWSSESYEKVNGLGGASGLVLIDNDIPLPPDIPIISLKSPNVIVGIGCRRNTTMVEIEDAVTGVLAAHGILWSRVAEIVSIDLKKEEPGLLQLAASKKLAARFFSAAELDLVEVPSPSAKVQSVTGSASVCEAAAILAGQGELLIKKEKFARVTVAVARAKNRSREE